MIMFRRATQGFALPTIVITSVMLFGVLVAVMSTVSSARTTLNDQYQQALARDAAESGVAYAKYCYSLVAISATTSQWPKSGTLDTGDNCFGEELSGYNCSSATANDNCFIAKKDTIRTRFSVSAAAPQSGAGYQVASKGSSLLKRADNRYVTQQESTTMLTDFPSITGLSVGNDTVCAIQYSMLYCWGWNSSSQTGLGTYQGVSSPVFPNVLQPTRVRGALEGLYVHAVASGILYTCAIAGPTPTPSLGNAVYCWGQNAEYQFGNNTTTNSYTPVKVVDSTTLPGYYFTDVSTSWHTCVIAQNGSTKNEYCWGRNDNLQSGENSTGNAAPVTTDPKPTPGAPVRTGNAVSTNLTNVAYIDSVSSDLSCGINGTQVFCFGDNGSGKSGTGTTGGTSARARFSTGMSSATKVATNLGRVCALNAGKLYCWGSNTNYRTDSGPNFSAGTSVITPTRIHTSANPTLFNATVTDFAISDYNTCIVVSGAVWCSGYNDVGQLGQGNTSGPATGDTVSSPSQVRSANDAVKVGGLLTGKNVVRIVGGNNHFCAVTAGDAVYCWGANYHGQLGDGTMIDRTIPTSVKIPPPTIF